MIKFSKSHIIFNKHVTPSFIQQTCDILHIAPLRENETYLGIPFTLSRRWTHIFQPLLQRINLKMDTWKSQLSKVGRLIMIKSFLQVIPLHLMSCLKLPQGCVLALKRPIENSIRGLPNK